MRMSSRVVGVGTCWIQIRQQVKWPTLRVILASQQAQWHGYRLRGLTSPSTNGLQHGLLAPGQECRSGHRHNKRLISEERRVGKEWVCTYSTQRLYYK